MATITHKPVLLDTPMSVAPTKLVNGDIVKAPGLPKSVVLIDAEGVVTLATPRTLTPRVEMSLGGYGKSKVTVIGHVVEAGIGKVWAASKAKAAKRPAKPAAKASAKGSAKETGMPVSHPSTSDARLEALEAQMARIAEALGV